MCRVEKGCDSLAGLSDRRRIGCLVAGLVGDADALNQGERAHIVSPERADRGGVRDDMVFDGEGCGLCCGIVGDGDEPADILVKRRAIGDGLRGLRNAGDQRGKAAACEAEGGEECGDGAVHERGSLLQNLLTVAPVFLGSSQISRQSCPCSSSVS